MQEVAFTLVIDTIKHTYFSKKMAVTMRQNGLKIKFVLFTCVIILFLLIIENFITNAFQNRLLQSVVTYFQNHIDQMINEREIETKEKLNSIVKWNADFFTKTVSGYINNYAHRDIQNALKSFMDYPEIRAVQITEPDNSILASVWKNKDNLVFDVFPQNMKKEGLIVYKTDIVSTLELSLGEIIFYYSHEEINKSIAAIKKKTDEQTRQAINYINSRFRQAKYYQIIGAIFILLLLMVCIIVCLKILILKPLANITHIASELSKFDISFKVASDRQDEVGFLYESLDKMIFAFREVMLDIQSKCSLLSKTSDNLVRIASDLSGNSEEIHYDAEEIADAAVEMNANISAIANASDTMNNHTINVHSAIEHMNNNVNTVASATEEMHQTLSQIKLHAQKGKDITVTAVQMTKNTEKLIESLSKVGKEIGQVTKFIKQIAHKIDTLAINASISASKVNAVADSGFEAIAKEIKRFSIQSKESADSISIQIDAMKEISFDVIQFINNLATMIQDINISAKEIFMSIDQQSLASQEIASSAVQAHAVTREIKDNMSHLASSSDDVNQRTSIIAQSSNVVTQNIQRVGLKISDNNSISQNILKAANELTIFSDEFQQIVSQFKLSK